MLSVTGLVVSPLIDALCNEMFHGPFLRRAEVAKVEIAEPAFASGDLPLADFAQGKQATSVLAFSNGFIVLEEAPQDVQMAILHACHRWNLDSRSSELLLLIKADVAHDFCAALPLGERLTRWRGSEQLPGVRMDRCKVRRELVGHEKLVKSSSSVSACHQCHPYQCVLPTFKRAYRFQSGVL